MEQTEVKTRKKIIAPLLPLAIYRELAAHLRQVEGVQAKIIEAAGRQFDYAQSQVGGLLIEYDSSLDSSKTELVGEILNYYCSHENRQTTICAQDDPGLTSASFPGH